jgi:N6-L-threonylcarbamoyladenine synthase
MRGSGDFAFSFSGLKTAVRYLLPKLADRSETTLADVCASFQEAVVDVLVEKTLAAARAAGRKAVAVSGGVSCNSRLRSRMEKACREAGLALRMADSGLSTDNAAMIGWVALHRVAHGLFSPLTADIDPNLRLV